MTRNRLAIAALTLLALAAASCMVPVGNPPVAESLPPVPAPQALDREAAFSFAIMSDHKGDAPSNDPRMAHMVEWIADSGDAFVIGLGDHLCKPRQNPWLAFMKTDPWWHGHFYPNVADGENEFYGESQAAWGAGGQILVDAGLRQMANVTVRDNGAEYYAKIPVGDYRVHLVQLHYPDMGKGPFREDTKRYLVETLRGIDKGPTDIVIAAAHSRNGFWFQELSVDDLDVVRQKCDLVLSATTHQFGRRTVLGWGDAGPLITNTGSVTFPYGGCYAGYAQVHVLEDPLRLVVQYLDVTKEERTTPPEGYAFVKVIGGNVYSPSRPADAAGTHSKQP